MDKNFLYIITIVAFVLLGVNATFANTDDNGFYVQSLNINNDIEEDDTSSINMKTEKFPQEQKPEVNLPQPQQVYVQPIQYTYPQNYVQYRKVIGPYYTTGIYGRNNYNYKGFGYNYKGHGYNYGYSVMNKRPIFVTHPPPPPNIKPPIHNHFGGTGNHIHNNHPHHKF